MLRRYALLAILAAVPLSAGHRPSDAQEAPVSPSPAPTAPASIADDTLILLSVDVRTLPGFVARKPDTPAPQWRTSFGSERRSEPVMSKPSTAVDADIVLLQGVTEVPTLRRWFPAGQWRLVVSRQLSAAVANSEVSPVPTTAVAVRLRRGLRLTGQTHLLELADALGQGPTAITAAGTAVRVLIDGRQTWAISVLLPENCGDDCPGRAALENWHREREREDIRRVTGGRFERASAADARSTDGCRQFGLRLDPAPPPPRQRFTIAAETALHGCSASVSVSK